MKRRTVLTILMADDDEDDCLLTQEALIESRLANNLQIVPDGEVVDEAGGHDLVQLLALALGGESDGGLPGERLALCRGALC